MNSFSTVSFLQDFIPPRIVVLSPQNRSYVTSDVKLELTANEALSQILYCLDGNQNHTITGNATLTGLAYGTHNLTLYVADLAGNMGASETISFSVTKPEFFPTVTVAVILGVAVILVAVPFLIYWRHRKNHMLE